ncbi:uncharacterized protein G2W53_031866 [Senna tora]|uniref:Uncharacterized protein n=1 Tax=Senna tora TaxID=362788 RepID=A0A834W5U0_9FABA|nr:uncharacterized protein G2W53_031866 [Senna tora]
MNYLHRPGRRPSSRAAEPSPEQVNLGDLEATNAFWISIRLVWCLCKHTVKLRNQKLGGE